MIVEKIESNGVLFALIIRKEIELNGVNFFTVPDNSFQLGLLKHKKGIEIKPHIHKTSGKIINCIQEVLHVERGTIEVQVYNCDGEEIKSIILNPCDTILFINGGHGLKIIEDAKIIEVKQGPYEGPDNDKEFLTVRK